MPGGDAIFPAVNRAAGALSIVVASRDWHPAGHCSFAAQGGPWPVHCQAGTPGAEFHPALVRTLVQHVFSKGTEVDREAYSAFDGTGLGDWLRERGVERLLVAGLATDYCVRASALDAVAGGFQVVLLEDGVGAVNVQPGDGERALAEMRAAGVRVTTSDELA